MTDTTNTGPEQTQNTPASAHKDLCPDCRADAARAAAQHALSAALEAAGHAGYSEGYDDGFDDGFEDGYEAALADLRRETNSATIRDEIGSVH